MPESNVRMMFNELPKCRKCADHGYVTIMYPRGHYSTIKICDCAVAHERWGEDTFREIYDRPDNLYWDDMRMYFGGRNKEETQAIMRQYRLVQMEQKTPRSEIVKRYIKEEELR